MRTWGTTPCVMRAAHCYRGLFQTSPAAARRARNELRGFVSAWLAERDLIDFESAIGEALANIVEHANAAKFVICCFIESGNLVAEIHNDGPGFPAYPDVPKPQAGAIRGYGLFIMHKL